MKILKNLLKSLRLDNLKIAVYLWVFNLFFSSIIFYILFQFLSTFAGRSNTPAGASLDDFLKYSIDFIHNNQATLSLILFLILLVVLMFIIVSIFVSGGAYAILLRQEAKTFKNFLVLSIEHFFKFLKVFLLNLLNFAFSAVISALLFIIIWNVRTHTETEILFKTGLFLWFILTGLIMIYATAAYDFSRIIALKTGRNVFYSFIKALKFLFSNKSSIFILFLLYAFAIALFHLILSVILTYFNNLIPSILLILTYQIFIVLKYYLKTLIIHTEVNFVSSFTGIE